MCSEQHIGGTSKHLVTHHARCIFRFPRLDPRRSRTPRRNSLLWISSDLRASAFICGVSLLIREIRVIRGLSFSAGREMSTMEA
jgi:hypothetical protein